MRRLWLWLSLAAQLAGLAGMTWGGTVKTKVSGGMPVVPAGMQLTRLGGLIDASFPGLGTSALTPGGMAPQLQIPQSQLTPAVFDGTKLTVLLERAKSLDASGVQAVAAQAKTKQPATGAAVSNQPTSASGKDKAYKLLEAANSVLKDVSPEKLRSMPVEQLHAVSSLIMDQAFGEGAPRQAVQDGITALAQAKLERILSLRGQPTNTIVLRRSSNSDEPDHVRVQGVPPSIRAVRPVPDAPLDQTQRWSKPGTVFRHYTTKEGLEAILASGVLHNGYRPLMTNLGTGVQNYYEELTGVFLTAPTVKGNVVGTPKERYPFYVDFKLPGNLPLLDVLPEFPGIFFLIPLPARTQAWMRDLYGRWVRGEEISPSSEQSVRQINENGGPGPDLDVPVEIVRHGRVR